MLFGETVQGQLTCFVIALIIGCLYITVITCRERRR
jgi:hypothetical protein